MLFAFGVRYDYVFPRGLGDHTGALGQDDLSAVAGDSLFHSGADQRRLGQEQRHGLSLHVGAHQCSVGVVVL